MGGPDRRLQRTIGALAALWLALLAAACAHVTLVPAYDEQIDAGLTTLYADTSGFVDRMIEAAGTPAGSYAANADFYPLVEGRVDALIARAEAHRALGECPSTRVVARVVGRIGLPGGIGEQVAALPQDDCQVVLLRLIRDQYRDMAALHRLRGAAGFPPAARDQLVTAGVGALLRAAIGVAIATKTSTGEQKR